MTRGDKILAIGIVVVSVLLMAFFRTTLDQTKATYVSVQYNGEEIRRISLDSSLEGREYPIETELGYNIIEMGDGRVRVIEADCRDQIDVHQGWISKTGETLVCLPHRLVIEIKGGVDTDDVDLINY